MKKVPKSATILSDIGGAVSFSENEDAYSFEMVANSGKAFDNWYWGKLALDLEGAKFTKSKFPVLYEHDTAKIVGFSGKPVIDSKGLIISNDNFTFIENPISSEFANNAKQGFPYQASVRGNPIKIEFIEEGETSEVNGYKLKGPAYIWREWVYKESSVAVFGSERKYLSG